MIEESYTTYWAGKRTEPLSHNWSWLQTLHKVITNIQSPPWLSRLSSTTPATRETPRPEIRDAPGFWYRFTSLPLEIREIVYRKMFEHLPTAITLRWHKQGDLTPYNFPAVLPPACYVDRATFHESTPIFLSRLTITIGDAFTMQLLAHFLDRAPDNKAWKSIQDLRFESQLLRKYHWSINYKRACHLREGRVWTDEIFQRFTGLRHVSLEMDALMYMSCVAHRHRREGQHMFCPTTLFEGRNLRSVNLILIRQETRNALLNVTVGDLGEKIIRWFKEEIERTGSGAVLNIRFVGVRESSILLPEWMGWSAASA